MRFRITAPLWLSCLLIVAAFALTATTALSQTKSQPPIIDRELFFGDPEIIGAQISPDGKFIAFIKPFKGTRNVWVKRTEEPFDKAKPITADKERPIPGYFWSRDGKYVLFVQDKAGDENYLVYAVDPNDTPAVGQDVPTARNLTDLKGVRAEIYALPRTDPDAIYVGLNDRDPAWHDLYKVKISTGERTLVRKNTERIVGWTFDLKDQLRLASRVADNGDTEILRVDNNGFTKIYSCNVFESCGADRYHKDGQRVYFETNKGAGIDLTQLELFDPATGKEEFVESDPLKRVDLGEATFSDLTDELIATAYVDDRTRVYFKDKSYEADYNLLKKQFPGMDVDFASSTRDERLVLIDIGSDTDPGETYLFDRNTKKLTLQYHIREKLNRDYLAPMKAISYKSSDGLEIPAYLTLPKGAEAKNLPLIAFPHGGPWARDNWGYDAFAQFWANRGYAVLQPNFRGSTGYGKKFIDAGNKQWGDKMQDDITWGVKYLVSQGIADPKRVGIMGGSYGGYATLAGVTFTPDLYAAAVDYVGPSNLNTLLETIPPYWEAGRQLFYQRMGDPTTPAGKAQLDRQSPLNSANKIKTPLLVVQGANDPRVNKREADQIVIALRDRGFPVEYIVAPDEGHGFHRPVNNMAMFSQAEKFFAKYLGGRYQEGATPEVAARLKEITVDVKSVTMPKKVEAVAGAPKPASDLAAGTVNYKATLAVQGQTIPITTTTEIKDDGGNWIATETAESPAFGKIVDASTIEKGTLILKHRSIQQAGVTIELDFKDGKASGTMTQGGEPKPISANVGGALFADGGGAYDVLAHLPLAPNYTISFSNFDVQKLKPQIRQLKVVGMESVTVAGGTFDAFKVESVAADDESDKQTLWIAKDSRKVLKIAATIPSLGGALLTSEMVK
ncbi:MAG TPA: alpha/beta fold hydrolase [Pyrinomonadaceae bacterium]|nr:alpha/beta fold hydrolase [Pyrinomonadaceae bacterium]